MPGLFSRVKTWIFQESLASSDLNAEFDSIITNFVPQKVDDYSATVSQMQTMTSPGGVGTESQATSLAGEIERLRYVLNRAIGGAQWYDTPDISLAETSSTLGQQGAFPANRIVSGAILSATTAQPVFLVPSGVLARVSLFASGGEAFVYYVNGVQYSITANVNLSSLTAAPSSNNTCVLNDAVWDTIGSSNQQTIGIFGSANPIMTVASMGTEITALVGTWAGFKLGTEYFIGFVRSTTQIVNCYRSYFFDSTQSDILPSVVANGATVTLMKLTWVYVKTDGTLEAAYTNPVYSTIQPTSPASNDRWFDMANNTWKKYDGASFVVANSTLIGICLQNTTVTIAARPFDFHKQVSSEGGFAIEVSPTSATEVRSRTQGVKINVNGYVARFENAYAKWTQADSMVVGLSANKTYYFYVTDTGNTKIDSASPLYRNSDLYGFYHPHRPWRCLGSATTDGSSNFVSSAITPFYFPNGGRRLETSTIETAMIQDLAITKAKQEVTGGGGAGSIGTPIAVGKIAASNSCAAFTTASATFVDVTNLAVVLSITGNRPVWIGLVHDGSATPGQDGLLSALGSGAGYPTAVYQIITSGQVARMGISGYVAGAAGIYMPSSMFSTIMIGLPAGPNSFKLQALLSAGSAAQVGYSRLVAFEM